MAINFDKTIEGSLPVVQQNGLNTNKAVDFSNAPSAAFPAGSTIGGSAVVALATITSSSANALTVGPAGTTNPSFNVDASTASAATGLNVKSAAAAAGLAVSVISSGTNEALKIDAKGSGAITIGGTSTGQLSLGRGSTSATIFSGAVTNIATQNGTPTAAQLLGGLITHASTTGAGTLTLPTGTQLSTAVTGVATGDNFYCVYANTGNQTVTVTGATGSTVVGTAAVGAGKNAELFFFNTGTNAWSVYVTVSA